MDKKISFINFSNILKNTPKQNVSENKDDSCLFKNGFNGVNAEQEKDTESTLNTTLALGEEGGEVNPQPDEGKNTTLALGEDGINPPVSSKPKDVGLSDDVAKAVFGDFADSVEIVDAKFDDQGRVISFKDNLSHAEGTPSYDISYGEDSAMKIIKTQFSERSGQIEQSVVYRYDPNDNQYTTFALGEEGGNVNPQPDEGTETTLALGEEGGDVFTTALGEDGINPPAASKPKDIGLSEEATKAVFGEFADSVEIVDAKFDDQGRVISFKDNLSHAEGTPSYDISYGEDGAMKVIKTQFSERSGQVEQNVVYRYDPNDNQYTTFALGEEGGNVNPQPDEGTETTLALGEEGGNSSIVSQKYNRDSNDSKSKDSAKINNWTNSTINKILSQLTSFIKKLFR